MDIITKYNLADIVYIKKEVMKGHKISAIIEKIMVEVFSTEVNVITYQVSTTNLFHNSIFYEQDLITEPEANEILRDLYSEEIVDLERKIHELDS